MHSASSHRRRYNIVRESELDFCYLPNKYIFYLGTPNLGHSPTSVHEITSPQCSTINSPTYIDKKNKKNKKIKKKEKRKRKMLAHK